MNNNYLEKLKDPRWQKQRLEILKRDNWACQKCFDTKSTLNIHHKYYFDNLEPWETPQKYLITLCESCHESEKETIPITIKALEQVFRYRYLSDEIKVIGKSLYDMQTNYPSSTEADAIGWLFSQPILMNNIISNYLNHKGT